MTDDEGASGCDSLSANVTRPRTPQPATSDADEATVAEGTAVEHGFGFTDAEHERHPHRHGRLGRRRDGPGHAAGGATAIGSGSATHTYADDDVYPDDVHRLRRSWDVHGRAAADVTVTNVAPTCDRMTVPIGPGLGVSLGGHVRRSRQRRHAHGDRRLGRRRRAAAGIGRRSCRERGSTRTGRAARTPSPCASPTTTVATTVRLSR